MRFTSHPKPKQKTFDAVDARDVTYLTMAAVVGGLVAGYVGGKLTFAPYPTVQAATAPAPAPVVVPLVDDADNYKPLTEAEAHARWLPKTVPTTSRNAGHITSLTDCDDHCQRQQRRLDKRDAHDFVHRYADGGRHYRRELDGISDGSGQVKHYGDRLDRDRRNNR